MNMCGWFFGQSGVRESEWSGASGRCVMDICITFRTHAPHALTALERIIGLISRFVASTLVVGVFNTRPIRRND